ncbi:MAG: sensor histidine kinase [Desulfatiglandales bacterium]
MGTTILVPVIPFILVLGIGYYYFTTSLETNTIAGMKRIVEDHCQMIESFLSERKANLEFILYSYSFEELSDPKMLQNVFQRLQRQSSAFVDLGLFNEEGIHITYHGPYKLMGKDYGMEPWFHEVIKKGVYTSDIFLGFRRVPHFVIALRRNEGNKTWIIRATIDTYMFSDLVKKVRIGKTGEAYLLNERGIFQTERRSGGSLLDQDPDGIQETEPHRDIRAFIRKDNNGETYLYATTWLKAKRWMLVVRQEKADAFQALRSATHLIIVIVLLGGAGIIATAFYITGRIVRSMEKTDQEKDRLGEQLIRATRLAELGEMAAGFAHEINNPLQIMTSEQALIDTILSDLKKKGEIQDSEDLKEMEDSMNQIGLQIGRCAQITQAILKFGRKTESVSSDLDLGQFIPEIIEMVSKKASVQGIRLEYDIEGNTPPIHGDPAQLQQVLLNLFNNAFDAIVARHGSEGGELILTAGPVGTDKVRISVRDNGCGISRDNLKRVFTPFFTTKPVGQGTGLGLSVCYGIIDGMGGEMTVHSEKASGTTFTIILPAVGWTRERRPQARIKGKTGGQRHGKNENDAC